MACGQLMQKRGRRRRMRRRAVPGGIGDGDGSRRSARPCMRQQRCCGLMVTVHHRMRDHVGAALVRVSHLELCPAGEQMADEEAVACVVLVANGECVPEG